VHHAVSSTQLHHRHSSSHISHNTLKTWYALLYPIKAFLGTGTNPIFAAGVEPINAAAQ
jgi:hypothetical protein